MQNDCGNIYRSARKFAGLTQERAAELLGLSVRSLADYETGYIYKICVYYRLVCTDKKIEQ